MAVDNSWWKDLVDFEQHDLPQRTTSSPDVFMYGMLARDHLRELINALNRWRHDIARLSTWAIILDGYDDQGRFDLLWEFVEPIAESTLGRALRDPEPDHLRLLPAVGLSATPRKPAAR